MRSADSGGGGGKKQQQLSASPRKQGSKIVNQLFSADSYFDIDDFLLAETAPTAVPDQQRRSRSRSNSSRFSQLFDRLEMENCTDRLLVVAEQTVQVPITASFTRSPLAQMSTTADIRPANAMRNRCASLPTRPSPAFFASLDRGKSLAPTSIIDENGTVQPLFERDGWPNFKAHCLMQNRQQQLQHQIAQEDCTGYAAATGSANSTVRQRRQLRPRGSSVGSLTGGGQQLQQSSSLLHRYAVHRAGSPLASTGSKQLSSSVGTAEQFYYRGAYPTPRPSPIPVATAVYPANKNNYSITVTSSQRAAAGSSVGSLVEGQNWHAVSSANVCQQIKYGFTIIETGSDHRQSHSLPSTPKKVTTIS